MSPNTGGERTAEKHEKRRRFLAIGRIWTQAGELMPASPAVAMLRAACFEFAMIKRGKAEKWAARSERLSAALRENLKRRKAQARGRAGARAPGEHSAAADAKIKSADPDFRRNPGRE